MSSEAKYVEKKGELGEYKGKVSARSAVTVAGEGTLEVSGKGVSLKGGLRAEAVALQVRAEGETPEYEFLGLKVKASGEAVGNIGAIGASAGGVAEFKGGSWKLGGYAGASALFGGRIGVTLEVDASRWIQAVKNAMPTYTPSNGDYDYNLWP